MTQSNNTLNNGNKYYMRVFKHSEIFYPSDWSSLYIHTLPTGYHSQLMLTKLLEETRMCIGKVKRIDLVHKKHKDGEIQFDGYSAFIHFTHWYQNGNVDYLRKSIDEHGICDISGVNISQYAGIQFVDAFGKPVYIRFSKNTKPIPEIEFNSHQLSEKLAVAENTIIQQQFALTRLDDQMTKVMQLLSDLTSIQQPEHARLNKLEHQTDQVMKLLTNMLSSDETLAKPVYTGPPGFESDEDSDSDDEDQIDHELLEALRQEPDESDYVNISGMVDFDAFILEQQQSADFQPIQHAREHFRIDELKTENTFWSETVFSHTSVDSKYPQKNT